ncbi:MAG TPA: DUF4430 domain-containing protein [Blastocatellia bacterium]|nr:DUF4430 domain-containing protein [Blastocatellia bacterium]
MPDSVVLINYRPTGLCPLFLILLTLLSLNACARRQTVATPKAAPTAQTAAPAMPEREAQVVIAYGGEDGKTALELLKARAKVRTTSSSLGELVTAINDVASGNGYNLIYYVNGAMAKTGAGSYITKNGDRIEWKLVGPRKQQ